MILPDTLSGARLFQQTKIPRIPSSSFLPSGAATGRRFQTSPARRAPCGGETKHTTPGAPVSIPGRFFFPKKNTFFFRGGRATPPPARPFFAGQQPRHHVEAGHASRRGRRNKGGTPRDPGRFLVSPPRHGPASNASPQQTGRYAACVPRYSLTEFHRHQAPRSA